MSHAPRADRLLIRPTSGRQAGTGIFARTNPHTDTPKGSARSGVTDEEHDVSLNAVPDGTSPHSHSQV